MFSFSKSEGTLPAKTATRIIVTFTPQATVNYYERVFCLVRNHSVLCVDLIGTCYDILVKPVPLQQRHVDIYRHKVIMGIHKKSRKEDELSFSEDGEQNQEIPIDDPSQVVLHKEMLQEASNNKRDL